MATHSLQRHIAQVHDIYHMHIMWRALITKSFNLVVPPILTPHAIQNRSSSTTAIGECKGFASLNQESKGVHASAGGGQLPQPAMVPLLTPSVRQTGTPSPGFVPHRENVNAQERWGAALSPISQMQGEFSKHYTVGRFHIWETFLQ